eukprot:GFUD01019206.1.p1 GENE.GFUD01019206.1~~GFUD01019206.1.p1  ORF type:complete len:822 (+),score=86.31 GFUD01019206.1:100-2565(+)
MFLIILTALGTADAGCYGYGCGTKGVWSSWGSWSTCSSSCGLGSQVRTRSCSQGGGCSGSSQANQHCQGYGYGCGTKGVWSSWESWSTCSSSCGLGSQVRTRSCSKGGGCSGSSQETQQCQGYGYGCGTKGVWSSWESWSTCSSSCGLGNQVRTRSCSQVGGCSGSSQATQQCQGYGYGCGTKGVWSSWESWSTCSSSCGLGNQVRTRSCSQVGGCSGSSQATQQCQGYGYGCGTGKCTYRGRTYGEGAQIQTAAGCNTCTCLVNGNLSCTEKFCPSVSNCTTVGGPDAGSACIFPFTFDGVKYTKCTTHRDMDGKAWCSTFTDSRGTHVGGQGNWGYCGGVCGRDPKGLWTPWGAWGTCSSSCGVGSQVRTRSCSQGLCSGSSKATQQCQGTKRVRRNVNTLTSSEKTSLSLALQKAISSKDYENIANFHGFPETLCSGVCCPHGSLDFLPWHRLFMVQMEEVLGEALPYWDWTENGSVPALWESLAAPIKQGNLLSSPRCNRPNLNTVKRSSSITINANGLKKKTKTAFMATTFAIFHDQISLPHNEVHVSMECEMWDPRTAAYDPIFYLHHAYVDKQFAFWQELQRLRGLSLKMENHPDLLKSLPPFDNKKFNKLQKTRIFNWGNETFDYKENYCYEYDDLTFDGETPEEFLSAMTSSFSPASVDPTQDATVQKQLPAAPPLPTVYVGIILPKTAPSGFHQFALCLAGSCVSAGRVATFGSPSQNTSSPDIVAKKTHYLVEYEVTDLVNDLGWKGSESEFKLTAKLVNNRLKVPAPVVILRYRGGEVGSIGTVVIGPKQQRQDYGDLLDKFERIIGGN